MQILLLLLAVSACAASADWLKQLDQSMRHLPGELEKDATKLKRSFDSLVGRPSPLEIADRPSHHGYRPSPLEIADRPSHHGYRPSPFEIADRPSHHGYRPSPLEIADRPSHNGYRPSPFEIADRPSHHGYRPSPLEIADRPSHHGYRPSPLEIADRHSGHPRRIHRVFRVQENFFYTRVCFCGGGVRTCKRHYKPAFYGLIAAGCLLVLGIVAFAITAVVVARRRRLRAAAAASPGGGRLLGSSSGLSVQCDPVMGVDVYGQKLQKVPV